jgi:two-component system, response regulator, stage 0 sporulation protein F
MRARRGFFFTFRRVGVAVMPKTILIVEDEEVARIGLATILQAEGYETVTAVNGREALERFQAGLVPDFILLDMILPGYDGWRFCAHRRDGWGKAGTVPFAIMTGLGIASEDWAKAMGAVALLRKPLDVTKLLDTVRQFAYGNSPVEPAAQASSSR